MNDTESSSVPMEVGQKLWLTMRRPRILLWLLAAWSVTSVLPQVFVESGLFLDTHGIELDGALGGLAFGWNGLAFAALYIYCSRDPARFHAVFWLALVHQLGVVAGPLYHLLLGTFTFESVVIPVVVGGVFGLLVFLHVFEPKKLPMNQPA